MFAPVLRETVRSQFRAALLWSTGLAVLLVAVATGWARAYPDAAARQLLARQVATNLSIAEVFYGEPRQIATAAGFVSWRGVGLDPLLAGLFVVIATTAVARGSEERGQADLLVAAPVSRPRIFCEQAAGLLVLVAIVATGLWLGLLACGPAAGVAVFAPERVTLATINVVLAVAVFGALSLAISQLVTSRRLAASIAGAALVLAHLWNNLGLTAHGLAGARWLSPLYLNSRSSSLAGGRVDLVAMSIDALLTILVGAAACALYLRRDAGDAALGWWTELSTRLFRPTQAQPGAMAQSGLRTTALGNALANLLAPAAMWGIALAGLVILVVAITPAGRQTIGQQLSTASYIANLHRGNAATDSGFIEVALFGLLPPLLGIFVLTLAGSWPAEELGGRLDVELSYPIARTRLFMARFAATSIATGITVAVVGLVFLLSARLVGLELKWGNAAGAMLLLLPLLVSLASIGYCVAGCLPSAVTRVLGLYLALGYFVDLLAPALGLPGWVRWLSVFHLYGQPLILGVDWIAVVALIALSAVLMLAGVAAFARRDLVV